MRASKNEAKRLSGVVPRIFEYGVVQGRTAQEKGRGEAGLDLEVSLESK